MDKSHLTLGVQRCVQTDKVFALLRAIKAQCCPSLQIMTLNTQGPGIERLQNVAIGSRRKELRKKSLKLLRKDDSRVLAEPKPHPLPDLKGWFIYSPCNRQTGRDYGPEPCPLSVTQHCAEHIPFRC